MVDAAEALRIGLIDHLVEARYIVSAAVDYALELLVRNCSHGSMSVIKSQLRQDTADAYGDSYARAEQLMLPAFKSVDAAEGISS
jgi:enoyl-CoA hydratase/carnithine racemase